MKHHIGLATAGAIGALAFGATVLAEPTNSTGFSSSDPSSSAGAAPADTVAGNPDAAPRQSWNWHVQNTGIVQWAPPFPAQYSGPNSLQNDGQVEETVSL